MPRWPASPCRYPGCNKLSVGRFCPEHQKLESRNYEKYKRDKVAHRKYDSRWRKIRASFLAKHPLCDRCKERGVFVAAVDVHHILPLRQGGTHDENNLMALCHSCHSSVHAAEKFRR